MLSHSRARKLSVENFHAARRMGSNVTHFAGAKSTESTLQNLKENVGGWIIDLYEVRVFNNQSCKW